MMAEANSQLGFARRRHHSRLTGRYVSTENAIVVKGLRKSFKKAYSA
jgi:hypothetical protein